VGILVVEAVLLGILLTASSPLAIMAVLVMLPTQPGGTRSAASFVAGWASVLTLIGLVPILVTGGVDFGSDSTGSSVAYGLQLGLGVASCAYAAVRIRRARQHRDPPPPKWLDRAARIPPLAAFGMGALLPYYVVAVACVNEVLQANLGQGASVVAYLAFVATTTLLLASPLIVIATAKEGSDARLAMMRAWLDRNSQLMITLVVAGLGVLLVLRGLVGLLS
jgi:hypothetical protein